MKRIIIIGCPGSGKSTLARKLADITKLPLYHLDLLNWKADRTTVEPDVFLKRQQSIISQERWLIDGNYGSSLEMRFKACDTVIFLDYPVDVCLTGVYQRLGTKRLDMPWVETELDQDFIEFIRHFSETSRHKILALMKDYPEKTYYCLRTREETNQFLKQLKKSIQV